MIWMLLLLSSGCRGRPGRRDLGEGLHGLCSQLQLHVSLLQHHDLRRHLSKAAGDLLGAVCVEVVKVCFALGNLHEVHRLLGILSAHGDQTAVKICEGLSILVVALGVVSGTLQNSLDGVLVLLRAFVVFTVRDSASGANLPALSSLRNPYRVAQSPTAWSYRST